MVPSTETYATNLESSATCRCSHVPQPRICGNYRLGNSTGRGLVGLVGSFATMSATTMDADIDSRTRRLPSATCFEDEAVRRAEYVQAVQSVKPVPGRALRRGDLTCWETLDHALRMLAFDPGHTNSWTLARITRNILEYY